MLVLVSFFFSMKIYVFLQRHSREFKYPRRDFRPGSISFSMKSNDFWWFLMFFACFLNHCKTGVLIFWRSISTKKHRFSRVFRGLFDPLQNRRVDFLTLNFASSFYAQRRVLVHYELPKTPLRYTTNYRQQSKTLCWRHFFSGLQHASGLRD